MRKDDSEPDLGPLDLERAQAELEEIRSGHGRFVGHSFKERLGAACHAWEAVAAEVQRTRAALSWWREHAETLDRNWSTHHDATLGAIRLALGMPGASVPEMVAVLGQLGMSGTRPICHVLKTWPEPFAALWTGSKTAEFRRDDRGFQPGDRLELREYDPATETYRGRWIAATIGDIRRGDQYGIPDGYAMLSLVAVERFRSEGG